MSKKKVDVSIVSIGDDGFTFYCPNMKRTGGYLNKAEGGFIEKVLEKFGFVDYEMYGNNDKGEYRVVLKEELSEELAEEIEAYVWEQQSA